MKISNLHKTFKETNFSLDVDEIILEEGKINCIIGDNGSGKSTLLKEMILDKTTPFTKMMLLQKPYIYTGSVLDNIKQVKRFCPNSKIDENELLDKLNLKDHLNTNARSLSGGQRQRLAFLLVLLSDYDLIILDEPFNNIDVKSQKVMIDIMKQYQKTYLLVSHKINLSKKIGDYFILMDHGNIIDSGNKEEFFNKNNKIINELLEME